MRKWFYRVFASMVLLLGYLGQLPLSQAADVLSSLDLRQVQVGGEMDRRIDALVNNNLLVLNTESFVAPFRVKTATAESYVGLGKLIDAAVESSAYTGNSGDIALKTRLVNEAINNQRFDGYIGMMASSARMWTLWDIHEMSYLVTGFVDDYRYYGNESSLNAARKTADYIIQHWSEKPANWPSTIGVGPDMPIIGTDEAMLKLYRATNDQRYLNFSAQQLGLNNWNQDIVLGRTPPYLGHAYCYLTRSLAQLELYRVQPNPSLLSQATKAINFLTGQNGMTITGAFGQSECWDNQQTGSGNLGETCATAYAIRNYDSLLRLQGDSRYGDLMERTVLNTLYAAQSPDGRQIRYYTPLEGQRSYFWTDTYCCPGNFRRVLSELPDMVYYASGTGLAVNLYTPSNTTVSLNGGTSLSVTQSGDYLGSGDVAFRIDPSQPTEFPFQLRIPSWCKGSVSVKVNGQAWPGVISPGSFFTIDRQWSAGDQVTLDLPMEWRFVLGTGVQSGLAALMRGPMVYCFDPGQNPTLASLDVASLKALVLDPTTVTDLPDADPLGGMACQVKAYRNGTPYWIKLTQFPNPNGKDVYFHLTDLSSASADEFAGMTFQVPEPGALTLLPCGVLGLAAFVRCKWIFAFRRAREEAARRRTLISRAKEANRKTST